MARVIVRAVLLLALHYYSLFSTPCPFITAVGGILVDGARAQRPPDAFHSRAYVCTPSKSSVD